MDRMLHGTNLLLAAPLLPPALYAVGYLAFRRLGLLSVNESGWHAGTLRAGGRVLLPAFGLFSLFQPLLGLESKIRRARRAAKKSPDAEPAISEVVVEVISFG